MLYAVQIRFMYGVTDAHEARGCCGLCCVLHSLTQRPRTTPTFSAAGVTLQTAVRVSPRGHRCGHTLQASLRSNAYSGEASFADGRRRAHRSSLQTG
jgi:hypothetical protein